MSAVECHFCGKVASRLCDGRIAWARHGDGTIDLDGEHAWCDAPLCESCAHPQMMHWREDDGKVDHADLCPLCHAARNGAQMIVVDPTREYRFRAGVRWMDRLAEYLSGRKDPEAQWLLANGPGDAP